VADVSELPVYKRLFQEPYAFDFFQAVRLLDRMPDALARFDPGGPAPEVARFRAQLTLNFPASAIHDLAPPREPGKLPEMTVTFLGLFGPSGVLPRHYTEQLLRLERDARGPERRALRDWLDLFNHRFISLFRRAWEKYRFYLDYERGRPDQAEPDDFTRALLSLVGLGTPWLRNRLRVTAPGTHDEPVRELAKVHDLGLLRFAGLLAQRHRNAWGLGALLVGYFGLPIEVKQFQGQWLPLEEASQSRLGLEDSNCLLGENVVAGDRLWDVQGKVRLRVGPLRYAQFLDYLPDTSPVPERKAFFLLCHVARLYLGPEFDFDVQLVLRAEDVPACRLTDDDATGPRLGWNCWMLCETPAADAEEAVFGGHALTRVGADARSSGLL
jgi:type VI secretion system protein ImpH